MWVVQIWRNLLLFLLFLSLLAGGTMCISSPTVVGLLYIIWGQISLNPVLSWCYCLAGLFVFYPPGSQNCYYWCYRSGPIHRIQTNKYLLLLNPEGYIQSFWVWTLRLSQLISASRGGDVTKSWSINGLRVMWDLNQGRQPIKIKCILFFNYY